MVHCFSLSFNDSFWTNSGMLFTRVLTLGQCFILLAQYKGTLAGPWLEFIFEWFRTTLCGKRKSTPYWTIVELSAYPKFCSLCFPSTARAIILVCYYYIRKIRLSTMARNKIVAHFFRRCSIVKMYVWLVYWKSNSFCGIKPIIQSGGR